MRVSRGVLVTLLVSGLLALPVVSFSVFGSGAEPGSLTDVTLRGIDRSSLEEAPRGLVVAADVHAAGDSPEVVPTDAAPVVLTKPIETNEFAAVGFSWDAATADGVVVQARVREDKGWSEWFPLPQDDDGPDTVPQRRGGRANTGLVLTSGADALQVRADAATGSSVERLRAVLIDPGTNGAAGLPMQTAGAATRPAFISRAQWGATQPTGDCAPTYSSRLKAAIIHHTVSTNSYTPDQAAGLVRSIWIYHTLPEGQGGNGWCDIGYNAIVDRFGQVFEGAAGGIDRNVIGAHAGGFNTYTFGVSTLGRFDVAQPPAALTEAVAQTIAWKFELEGVDPLGTTQLVSGGQGTAKYVAGTVVTLPTIMGHRDVGATECPGGYLYAQVGAIRARVVQLVGDIGKRLLRTADNATVYVVSGTSKYTVVDMATLGALAPLGPVGYVSQQYLDRRTTVSTMSRVVLASDGTVYFLDAGIKLPFMSCAMVADYGASCANLVRLDQSLIDAFHSGPPITPIYRTTTGKAFLVSVGTKREVADDQALTQAGLPTSSVTLLETGLSNLPYGAPVIRDGVVLKDRDTRAVSVVAGGAVTTVSDAVQSKALSSVPLRELDDASMRFLTPTAAAGVLVKDAGGPATYLLTEQGKKLVADAAMLPASVPQMSTATLALFPDAATLAAGTFLKGSVSGTISTLRDGRLRGISAWADLVALNGGNPSPPTLTIDQKLADLIPNGPLQLGPGALVVSPRTATVYFVNGPAELLPLGSFAVTNELGANRLVRVADTDIDAYSVGSGAVTTSVDCAGTRYLGIGGKLYRMTAPVLAQYPALAYRSLDATTCAALAKGTDLTRFLRAADGTIFYVESGVKRPITSYGAYLTLGGTPSTTIQSSAFALSLIPDGAVISASVAAGIAADQEAPATTAPGTTTDSPTDPATAGTSAPDTDGSTS